MNFIQDYVRGILLSLAVISFTWRMGIGIAQKYDNWDWKVQKRECSILLVVGVINAIILVFVESNGWRLVLLSVFAGCLLFACFTDCKNCEIYQFTWWLAGLVGLLLVFDRMWKENSMQMFQWGCLVCYCLLQEYFFSKFYGRADCHAFVVCALAGFGVGMDEKDWLIHMLLAFGILAILQLFRGNINRKGNLKSPVAFLPYITMAFWIKWCCFYAEKMVY